MLKLKKHLYQKVKKDPQAKIAYNETCRLYKQTIIRNNKKLEQKAIKSLNKKTFFGYVRRKLKTPTTFPPLINDSNEVFIQPEDKANAFNNYFSKSFIIDDNNLPTFCPNQNLTQIPPMNDREITPDMVTKSIANLKMLCVTNTRWRYRNFSEDNIKHFF